MRFKIVSIMMCIFLCGCSNEVNKMRIVHTIGYDRIGETIKGTILSPNYVGGIPAKSEILTDSSITSKDILFGINRQSNYTVQIGQLRTVLFGMNYAKRDIGNTIRSLVNNPEVGRQLNLAVTDHEAQQVINATSKKDSLYLYNLIDQNIKTGNIPNSNLHIFLCSYYSEWEDSFLPFLKTNEKKEIIIDGLSLFKDKKYVMNLTNDQAFFFTVLYRNTSSGFHLFSIKQRETKDLILLQNIESKVKYSMNREKIPDIKINVKVNGMIKDYPDWLDLEKKSHVQIVEKQIEDTIENEGEALIHQLQEKNVDSLGIGSFIRSKRKNWSNADYKKNYQKMKMKVDVNVSIVQSGIGE